MIAKNEFKTRRQQLASQLPPDSIAIIPASPEILRNGDAHYRFRQDSDFYYLTGFVEPDALLLITAGKHCKSILFSRPRDLLMEQWTGKRIGQEGACTELGVDEAFPITRVDHYLPQLLEDKKGIYQFIGRYPQWEKRILKAWKSVRSKVRQGTQAPEIFGDLSPLLSEIRLFKSDQEINLMQRAANISVAAHRRAMQSCRTLENEYQLEAELRYEFTRHGCRDVAYDPIVAAGENACILHYTDNNKPLNSGDLVLIDAGGEYECYAADITRTFPVNGRFSPEQREIYQLVWEAQRAGIAQIRPGCIWYDVQEVILQVLTTGLVDLRLLSGSIDGLIESEAYKPFYMHHSGHWLGLDVHDCGQYKINKQWRPLQAGMVLTVEPGLYISKDIPSIDPRWQGIGVRIEDDIHVTVKGSQNLSGELPSAIDEIEALVRG